MSLNKIINLDNYGRIFFAAICMIYFIIISGNSRASSSLDGILIDGWGSAIGVTEIRQGVVRGHRKPFPRDQGNITSLSKLSTKSLIFSDSSFDIYRLDLENMKEERIGSGISPVYIQEENFIVYYNYNKNENSVQLVYREFSSPENSAIAISKRHFYIVTPVVNIGRGRIIFIDGYDKNASVKIFDLINRKEIDTGIFGCVPHISIGYREKIICFDIKSDKYILTDLNGIDKWNLPWPRNVIPILYIDETNEIIVSYEQGRRHGIAILSSKKAEYENFIRLYEDLMVGFGGLLFYPF